MNILFLSPQPIYQDRGSPIAVDMLLRELSARGHHVDVITYHEGRDIIYDHVTLYRIPNIPVRNLQPGFSWKKIVCDIFMFYLIITIFLKNRRRYHVIHAVEEAAFFALLLKWLFGMPYVYDMDSSLSQQMLEQMPFLKPFAPLFQFCEGLVVRHATAVIPVCEALAKDIAKYNPRKVVVLNDVSLLHPTNAIEEDLRTTLGIKERLLLYVGNLQSYQGIDLLLDSFALALQQTPHLDLVVIGGTPTDIKQYQQQAINLGIHQKVHFIGPRPIDRLAEYLSQADILLSPRIKGRNTPMKIYSYLHSGRALLATDIHSHTQVLTNEVAYLTRSLPEAYAQGIIDLAGNETTRLNLGHAGKQLIENEYTLQSFQKKLNYLFDWLATELRDSAPSAAVGRKPILASTKKAP